jgi:hypothetical protein
LLEKLIPIVFLLKKLKRTIVQYWICIPVPWAAAMFDWKKVISFFEKNTSNTINILHQAAMADPRLVGMFLVSGAALFYWQQSRADKQLEEERTERRQKEDALRKCEQECREALLEALRLTTRSESRIQAQSQFHPQVQPE